MAKAAQRITPARIALVLLLVAALVFAVQGGEYGTSDLVMQHARKERLERAIDSLSREVDSLGRVRTAIQSDPATQERIAREEFGMVRGNREMLYRFGDADSTRPEHE